MKFRQLEREGVCSLCCNKIMAKADIVVTSKSGKHRKLVVICTRCARSIYNEVKKERLDEG